MPRSLMLLSEDARALDDLIEAHAAANDGDLTDIDETITAWLGELTAATAEKVDSIAWLIREWEARADARRKQAQQLQEAAAGDANRAARLKSYVMEAMRVAGRQKLEGSTATLAVQRNGGKDPVMLTGEVPRDYCRVVYEPDKEQIRTALERGKDLPFATLAPRGYSLRVR